MPIFSKANMIWWSKIFIFKCFVMRRLRWVILLQLILSALFLKLHPLPMQYTPSYQNSVIFAGVGLGVVAGLNFSHQERNFQGISEDRRILTPVGLALLLLRILIGETSSAVQARVWCLKYAKLAIYESANHASYGAILSVQQSIWWYAVSCYCINGLSRCSCMTRRAWFVASPRSNACFSQGSQ